MEEDFGRGPWLAMKSALGLEERDPTCFLCTYSIVMVLRKVRVLGAEMCKKDRFYPSYQPAVLFHLRKGAVCLLPLTPGPVSEQQHGVPFGCVIFRSPSISLASTVSGTGGSRKWVMAMSLHIQALDEAGVSTLLPFELPRGQVSYADTFSWPAVM